MSSRLALLAILVAAAPLTACNKKAKYVDPDARSSVEGTGLEARDIRAVVGQMSTELMASQMVAAFDGAPRVAVLPMENRSRFLVDQDIFTSMITDELVMASNGKLAVVNRDLLDTILKERELKRSGKVDTQGSKSLSGVEFFLMGVVNSLSASTNNKQTDYVVVHFTLTDAESGVVGWSNRYEMKKQGSWGVLYQ
ncbi:MAG: TolB-like protein [Myxococcota bacterium]|jgi:TolB-like protein